MRHALPRCYRACQPAIACLALGAMIFPGCGGNDGRVPIVPVYGTVLVNGKPAFHAEVTLHPVKDNSGAAGLRPLASVEENGTFRPSTYSAGDGAPAGEYNVTVVWPAVQIDQGEEITGPDRLGGRYRDPLQSGIKVTVRADNLELPTIQLAN